MNKTYTLFSKDSMSTMQTIAPIDNHRQREQGLLVYPVYSRRSGGLSLGINLFPDRKRCSFDCPYCEVFPFAGSTAFSLEQMETELRAAVAGAKAQNVAVKDICFSGNGEPSQSPAFPAALQAAGSIRAELAPAAKLVVITNGAGLLEPAVFACLRDATAGTLALDVWLKADAGTPEWYAKINGSAVPFEKLAAKIREFAACAPLTIQTMLCAVDGAAPPPEEAEAWERLLLELARAAVRTDGGSNIRTVQIYGKARPAPEDPKAQPLPLEFLEGRAASLRRAFMRLFAQSAPPVEMYL